MTYYSEVMADFPIAYYRLGESSGTTAVDASGNSHDGTYEGSPILGYASQIGSDPVNKSVFFDGTDDRVIVPGSSLGITPARYSIEAVVNQSMNTGLRTVAARHTGGQIVFWLVISDGIVQYRTYYTVIGWDTLSAPVAINPATKHHIVATYGDPTKPENLHTKCLYIDGVDVGESTGGLVSDNPPLTIGSTGVGAGGSDFFWGPIDEVAYYDHALPASRVAAHYAALPSTITGSKRIRAYSVDCTGAAPVVESMDLRGADYARYGYSSAGTPAPVRVPGTNFVLVAAYGALQVWTIAGVMVSETQMPGDILGLWSDPADPTRAVVPCWARDFYYPGDDHLLDYDGNSLVTLTGIGTATPTASSRDFVADWAQYPAGSADPFIASPGLISLEAQPQTADANAKTSVEGTNYQTSVITEITHDDDFSYWDTAGSASAGPGVAMGFVDGQTTHDDASSDDNDYDVRTRTYYVDHRGAKPEAHIVDVPLKPMIPATDGVPPQVDSLRDGSHALGIDTVRGRTLLGATMVSNDYAPLPYKESRYSLVASAVKHPTFGAFPGTPPPAALETTKDYVLTGTAEAFYDLSTTDGGNHLTLVGPVPADADHTKVGAGPLYLDTFDDATSYMQVSHVQENTDLQFVLDGMGTRFASWEPDEGDGPVVGLLFEGRMWADSTGYGGSSTFSLNLWAYDLGNPAWAGTHLTGGSGTTSTWATAHSSTTFDREDSVPILTALKNGSLLVVADPGTAYYGDVNARVSGIRLTVTTLALA